MKILKMRTTALFLTLALVLTCILLPIGATTTAFADPEPEYTKVYYFTDNPDSASYCATGGLLRTPVINYGLTANNIERNYWPYVDDNNNFWKNFRNYLNNIYQLDYFADSFVIVENLGDFTDYSGDDATIQITEDLCTWFSQMQGSNCKIMFISGTDETRYSNDSYDEDYAEFLDYVDIHINMDILTVFVDSLMDEIENDQDLEGFTLLLDEGMYASIWDEYIVPYFNYMLDTHGAATVSDMCYVINSLYQIKVIIQDNGNLRELGTNAASPISMTSSTIQAIRDYIDCDIDRTFAVGATWSSTFATWMSLISNFRENAPFLCPVYIYNMSNTSLSEYYAENETNFHSAGESWASYDTLLGIIMNDFIMGNSLLTYNNWQGRCNITFKPISPSPNGWLHCCRGLPCWNIITQ